MLPHTRPALNLHNDSNELREDTILSVCCTVFLPTFESKYGSLILIVAYDRMVSKIRWFMFPLQCLIHCSGITGHLMRVLPEEQLMCHILFFCSFQSVSLLVKPQAKSKQSSLQTTSSCQPRAD